MITIVAKCVIKQGKKVEFINSVQDMIMASRTEAGNISYDLYEDVDNENILSFIEQWKDLNAIESHNNTQHFLNGVKVIQELSESLKITKYQKV